MHEKQKKTNLFVVLAGIFIGNALLAEIIGVKIFSLEQTLNLPGAQIPLLDGNKLDFNLTAGVLIWPVVFLTTDLLNEYFGKQGVRWVSFLTAGLIAYAFVVIYISIHLSPAPFWQEIHNQDDAGNTFHINFAFKRLFGQGLGIICGSLVAFLLGQLLDVFIFQKIKRLTGAKYLWLRATGSTLISQLIDSFVVLLLAFYLLAPQGLRWSMAQILSVAIINYLYKCVVALLFTPLLYLSHRLIDKYLGNTLSKRMQCEAGDGKITFF